MNYNRPVLLLLLSFLHWPSPWVEGRGRLVDPPARSSMWRFGYDTPINYNDNGINCGGRVLQWTVNQGKCGVCGDAYNGPRHNERGGKYDSGIIARSYTQGQVITVKVDVSSNEKGWFEFDLCPQSDPLKPVTEDCLQNNLLQLASGGTRYVLPATVNGEIQIGVKLPDSIVCNRCVFRWKWNAGNTWGTDSDGKSCLGCGQQEQFYGCSDVSVLPSYQGTGNTPFPTFAPSIKVTSSPSTPSTTITTAATTTTTPTTTTTTTAIAAASTKAPSTVSSTNAVTDTVTTKAPVTPENNSQSTSKSPASGSQTMCKGINEWAGDTDLDQWCQVNCVILNVCPASFCKCEKI